MVKKARNLGVTFLLLGSLLLTACVVNEGSEGNAEGETYECKLGHVASGEDHVYNIAAEHLAEELEERSDGRMTMELYPDGQLGSDEDMIQQLENGSLDFGLITGASLTSKSEAMSAWFAPFLFDSYEDTLEASNQEVSKDILETLEGSGLKAEDYFFAGFRLMIFRDKIETPDDIEGLTLRVTPSPALEDWYRMLGASPESIPLPDVYQSAETGVIDGMEMDLDAAVSSNFDEVTGYGAMTNHMVWPTVITMNEDLFDKMSDEDQEIVEEAIADTSEYATLERADQEDEYIDTLEDRGMELYDMDEELFDTYTEEFDKEYEEKNTLIKEFIEEFR